MKHFGDITKIKGYEVPIVDIVCGGSPCQDLSVAGRQAGLAGERSGLFMEQIRIIKEMREKEIQSGKTTNNIRPRYMVWENVPGAFSSNKGEDFRVVLEETSKIADKDTIIPRPPKGKWTPSGCILGDGWSIAWRVHDAQFWGVPQRRKRIALVADFGGHTAPEILFERESSSGNTQKSEGERKETSSYVGNGIGKSNSNREITNLVSATRNQSYSENDIAASLLATDYKDPQVVCYTIDQGAGKSSVSISNDLAPTLATTHQGEPVVCYEAIKAIGTDLYNLQVTGDVACALTANGNATASGPTVLTYLDASEVGVANDEVSTYQKVTGTLDACIYKGTGNQIATNDMLVANDTIVRRLTPLECERLQGYPIIRKVRFTEMTKNEYIAWNINEKNIVVDTEYGKVFATRGPGGVKLDEPKELTGSIVNGYRVVSIRNGETKMQCLVHRIVWIAEHGIIPDGYVIDHINNDKQDNRLCNLQLLTPAENSTKARKDGLYKIHGEAGQAKITDEVHDFIQYVYGNTDLSIRQLSEIFGISKSRVHQIIHDDGWTDIGDWIDSKGKKRASADGPRYKALGNSIALPFWAWMAQRMVNELKKDGVEYPTMASLFDGIAGFPVVYDKAGCYPSWASEVEEFCIAVSKVRFPEEEEN